MTDYVRDIGGSTSLMIRDFENGTVEFWMKTGSSTYNNQQHWAYSIGGFNSGDQVFRLTTGGQWQRAGSHYYGDIGGDYDITMAVTGAGLGYPSYTFSVHVSRARPPDPPVPPYIFAISDTSVDFGWGGDGGWGGATITGREFWWSNDGTPRNWIGNGGARMTLGGLAPGNFYNLWAKNANSAGWSGFSGATTFRTYRIPDAPTPVEFTDISQTSLSTHYTYDGKWDGGTPVREWQIGYGLDPNTPQSFVGGVDLTIDGLSAGKHYYFWARGRNDVGWSPWSARSDVIMGAGASVMSNGTFGDALPWVKVNGVWKLATPWTKAGGIWRKTR